MTSSDDSDFDWSSLDDIEVDTSEVFDYSSLSDVELFNRFLEVDDRLRELKELHFPHTPQGRELHSQRVAIVVLLKQKGIMS